MSLANALRADEYLVHRDTADDYAAPVWAVLVTCNGKDFELLRDSKEMMLDGSAFVGNRLGKIKPGLSIKGQFRLDDPDRKALKTANTTDPAPHINVAISQADITTTGTVYDKFAMLVSEYKEKAAGDDIVEFEAKLVLGDMHNFVPAVDVPVP